MTGAIAWLDQHLIDSGTLHVFETMFFRPLETLAAKGVFPAPAFLVKVDFQGEAEGFCEIAVTEAEAISLSQDFLALEPAIGTPAQDQVEEVLRELGNMVCGHVLSNSEPCGLFQILTPVCRVSQEHADLDDSWRRFQLDDGQLAVRLLFKSARSRP